jgi:hypothetical protein
MVPDCGERLPLPFRFHVNKAGEEIVSVIVPPAGIIRPDVMNLYGISELFADGGLCNVNDRMSETVFYRRYSSTECHAVLRVIMPRICAPQDGHDVSLVRAYVESVRGIAAH